MPIVEALFDRQCSGSYVSYGDKRDTFPANLLTPLGMFDQTVMKTEEQIDSATLMPSKRRMVGAALFIAVPMLVIGVLLGLMVQNAPRGALAVALGDAFLTGGPSAFIAPGSEWVALKAGILWGAVLAFLVGPIIFIAWLMYQGKKEFNRLQDEQKMKEYRRTIAGKSAE
jgi:hypothetical protein